MYGTPQSAAVHVIERYRLIDGPLARGRRQAILRHPIGHQQHH